MLIPRTNRPMAGLLHGNSVGTGNQFCCCKGRKCDRSLQTLPVWRGLNTADSVLVSFSILRMPCRRPESCQTLGSASGASIRCLDSLLDAHLQKSQSHQTCRKTLRDTRPQSCSAGVVNHVEGYPPRRCQSEGAAAICLQAGRLGEAESPLLCFI